MSEALYVSSQTIGNWENNSIFPSTDHLMGLAKCFGVKMNDIIVFNPMAGGHKFDHTRDQFVIKETTLSCVGFAAPKVTCTVTEAQRREILEVLIAEYLSDRVG